MIEQDGEKFISLKEVIKRLNDVMLIYSRKDFSDPWDEPPLAYHLEAENVINTAMNQTMIFFDKNENKFKDYDKHLKTRNKGEEDA